MAAPQTATQILLGIAADRIPADKGLALLYPAVYQELHRLAQGLMRDQSRSVP